MRAVEIYKYFNHVSGSMLKIMAFALAYGNLVLKWLLSFCDLCLYVASTMHLYVFGVSGENLAFCFCFAFCAFTVHSLVRVYFI